MVSKKNKIVAALLAFFFGVWEYISFIWEE